MRLGGWLRSLRARTPRRSERLYAGHRHPRRGVYVVTRDGLQPLPHGRSGADAPFDWGADDEGAVELASALLRDAGQPPTPDEVVRELAADLIAGLPRDGFVLSAGDVQRWLDRRRHTEHRATVPLEAWSPAQYWLFPFPWAVGPGSRAARSRIERFPEDAGPE